MAATGNEMERFAQGVASTRDIQHAIEVRELTGPPPLRCMELGMRVMATYMAALRELEGYICRWSTPAITSGDTVVPITNVRDPESDTRNTVNTIRDLLDNMEGYAKYARESGCLGELDQLDKPGGALLSNAREMRDLLDDFSPTDTTKNLRETYDRDEYIDYLRLIGYYTGPLPPELEPKK